MAAGYMRDSRIKSFAGNGMHLHVVPAVLAFVMAVTEKKPAPTAEGMLVTEDYTEAGGPAQFCGFEAKAAEGRKAP